MAKAIKRPAESWVYVLEADRALDVSQQTRFTLRPMTHMERAAVRDDLARQQTGLDGIVVTLARTRQQACSIALAHIVSIENFPLGAPAPWPSDVDARATYLDQLADDDVLEIGNEVWARSSLGADAVPVGNSSPPEHTSNSGGAVTMGSMTAWPAPSAQS